MTAGKTPSPQRIALASVVAAAVLVTIKLIVGLLSNSLGVLAEAIHSATDLAAALLTFFAVRVAVRPADRDHPYGHGKAEHLSALGESAILILASLVIATESIVRLSGHGGTVDLHWYTFAVLVVVIAIDGARSISSHRGAHRHESAALGANALHFTLDLIGSVAVLVGLVLVHAGYPQADSIAALLVAGLALFSAGRLMRRSVHVLMDTAPAGQIESRARAAIQALPQHIDLRRLRMREVGGRHFADIVVGVSGEANLAEGHAVASAIEAAIERELPGSDVVVHVEPDRSPLSSPPEGSSGALLEVRLAANATLADAEALARQLRAERPEVIDVAVRVGTDPNDETRAPDDPVPADPTYPAHEHSSEI
ncbi:MAG TPA: cation diffusion facilitator family transporter [Solirubrobacteraceae bacterium]|jgi:cation diffusion facilitator family transporter|nr:cation diffusion facilitator family transporter [Solirubrobacteraceae bacterium]